MATRGGITPRSAKLAVCLDKASPATAGLPEGITNLEELDPRAAQVVALRYFGGLGEADAAEAAGISVATLKRDWDFAKTWLAAQSREPTNAASQR
jgi:DNA-directed RNA polymerase specialized sigma24 family protein